MHKLWVIAVVALQLLPSTPLHAQDSVNFSEPVEFLSFWSGDIYDIALVNDLAFVATSASGLKVIDLSDPVYPVEQESLLGDVTIESIEVYGNYIYAYQYGRPSLVHILEVVSDDSIVVYNPLEIGTNGRGISLIDTFLLANCWLYDLADPEQPVQLNYIAPVQDHKQALQMNDTLWCVLCGDQLKIIDLGNPAQPAFVSSLHTSASLGSAVILSDLLYAGTPYPTYNDAYPLNVISLADPANPRWLGSVDMDLDQNDCSYIHKIDDRLLILGDHNFLLCEPGIDARHLDVVTSYEAEDTQFYFGVMTGQTLVCAVDKLGSAGIQRFTVTNQSIQTQGECLTGAGVYATHFQYGNLLYAGFSGHEIFVFDLTDPGLPSLQCGSCYDMPENGSSKALLRRSDFLYSVSTEGCLQVYDATDSNTLPLLSSVPLSPIGSGRVCMVEEGNYLAATSGNANGTLYLLNDPATPDSIWQFQLDHGSVFGLEMDERYIYVMTSDEYLTILDYQDQVLVSSTPMWITSYGYLVLQGNSLYVPTRFGTVRIDVSNVATPRNDNVIPGSNSTCSIVIEHPYAFTLDISSIRAFDLWDPLHYSSAGYAALTGNNKRLTISNDIAVIAESNRIKLVEMDVPLAVTESNPAVPEKIQFHPVWPNPFNSTARLAFTLPSRAQVRISVFNITGQLVRTLAQGSFEGGSHQVTWTGTDGSGKLVTSGIYFVQMQTDSYTSTQKLVFIQ